MPSFMELQEHIQEPNRISHTQNIYFESNSLTYKLLGIIEFQQLVLLGGRCTGWIQVMQEMFDVC